MLQKTTSRSLFIISILIFLFGSNLYSQNTDSLHIRNVIVQSYIEGLINAKDFNEARDGIHKDFEILGHRGDSLTKKSIDTWIKQRKTRPNLPDVHYTIHYIDIEGNAASSKIEMYRGSIKAVDFVFLYKFDNGWKIISAIDHITRLE